MDRKKESREMEQSSLEKLKEIIKELPDGNYGSYSDDLMELSLIGGIGYSVGLLKNEKVAVAKTVVSKGSIFAPHYHKEVEVIIVFEGGLKVWNGINAIDDIHEKEYLVLGAKETLVIDPEIPHIAEAIADTQLIAVTIPASKRFPNAKKR